MQLYGARITQAGPQGLGLTMELEVYNPNAFDVMVRNVRVTTTLAERFTLPMVAYAPNAWLAAGRSTRIQVPVVIPWAVWPGLFAATLQDDTVGYHAVGRADVTAVRSLGIRLSNFELDEEGEVSRAELVVAAARGLRSPRPTQRDATQAPTPQR